MNRGRRASFLASCVLTAAFIGPGTVTVCGAAGASHGVALLWALAFATAACIVLQEAGARVTIISGRSLGEAIVQALPARARRLRRATAAGVGGSVILGCAAYEAGNLVGGVSGLELVLPLPRPVLTLLCVLLAAGLLWTASTRLIAAVLGALVALMGGAFLCTAFMLAPSLEALAKGLLVPRIPGGSVLLVLGLVGTTVVPYNLFLGSALARSDRLDHLRSGLVLAIGLGGVFSMAVVVCGAAVDGGFSFAALSAVLADRLGGWASTLFAFGLFAAGFTSAVTAPLAAGFTLESFLAAPPAGPGSGGGAGARAAAAGVARARLIRLGVLAFGAAFAFSPLRPIPVIIAAQALNGFVLPLVAAFLWWSVNDRRLLGSRTNSTAANLACGIVVAVSAVLGALGIWRAGAAAGLWTG